MADEIKKDDATDDKKNVAPIKAEETRNVFYRRHQSFELYVGSEFLRFEAGITNPLEYPNGVPLRIINHPDFKIHSDVLTVI